jgi:hypothetical protein
LFVTVLTLISLDVFANTDRKQLLDAMAGSFYTGCIDGFMGVIEKGWYQRPKGETAQSVVEKVKKDCRIKAERYRKEIE